MKRVPLAQLYVSMGFFVAKNNKKTAKYDKSFNRHKYIIKAEEKYI